MRMCALIMVASLALVLGGGCADARNTWTPGDRKVNNQSLQGVNLSIGRIATLETLVVDRPAAAEILGEVKSNLATVELNLSTIEELHGPPPPEEIVAFSPKASEAARNQATQEHSKKGLLDWILTIGGYLTVAAGIAATLLNAPVVGPWLATTKAGQVAARILGGKIVKVGLDAVKTISVARSEAEDKPLTAQDVVRLAVKTFSPSTAAIADKVSNQIEKANKIEVTPIRELETASS